MAWVIFLVLCAFVVSFFVYCVRFENPYKLIFLFGKKGSGKTTLLVRYMTEYHKKGYSVYTNLTECQLPFVVHIEAEELGEYVARPKSMVALDEVGILYDSRKFKTFRDCVRDYFKFQRQYQNVVVMTSQSWDVDKRIRDLTDQFYLCGKFGPISYARQIARYITLTEPMGDSESRIADQLKYKPFSVRLTWIPRYARHFKSFNPPDRPFFVDPPEIPGKRRKSPRRLRASQGLEIAGDQYNS